MPKMRMLHSGVSLFAGTGVSADRMTERQKHNRADNRGWTTQATRNLANYLMALDLVAVAGYPCEATLTIPADCMGRVSSELMHRMLHNWLRAMGRHGMSHYVWVLEFTANRTAHIHVTMWLDAPIPEAEWAGAYPKVLWVRQCLAHDVPALLSAQDFKHLDDTPENWLKYVAKHSTRGVKHYQRLMDGLPDDWRRHPGAMWGHDRKLDDYLGERMDLSMSMRAFWAFRREIRRRMVQQAKTISDPRKRGRNIVAARRCLKTRLTPDEWRDKNAAAACGRRWRPESAFHGIRVWMSQSEQEEIIGQLRNRTDIRRDIGYAHVIPRQSVSSASQEDGEAAA